MGAFCKVEGRLRLLARLKAAAHKLQKQEGRVGVLAGATYPDGTPVSVIAAYLEYGWVQTITPKQAGWLRGHGVGVSIGGTLVLPPRPTFHETMAAKQNEWLATAQYYLKGFVREPEAAVERALHAACLAAQQDIQETIRTGGAEYDFALRSPVTLMLYAQEAEAGRHRIRGQNQTTTAKPLYRTGLFHSSIAYEIIQK